MVDDHAIDSLRTWLDIEVEQLGEEVESGKYKNLKECPSYGAVDAYRKAMNVLIKACYLPEYFESHKVPSIKQLVEMH